MIGLDLVEKLELYLLWFIQIVFNFLGVYINEETNENYIVTEYLARGNCHSLLRSNTPLNIVDLMNMSITAAKGMTYLQEKKIIHGDLATRNLLVSLLEGKYILKVSDFGLSRSSTDEKLIKQKKMPVRWIAPEIILKKSEETLMSDIWSFGITLWEMFTFGTIPYMDLNNSLVLFWVPKGRRLPKPEICPQEIYDIMIHCWNEVPNERPSFSKITSDLKSIKKNIKLELADPQNLKKENTEIQNDTIYYANDPVYQTQGELQDPVPPPNPIRSSNMYQTINGNTSFPLYSNQNSIYDVNLNLYQTIEGFPFIVKN